MVNLFSFLFAIGVGFGLSCWIFGTMLEKSNNIGDSKGDRADYQAYVNFTSRQDRLSNSERKSFSSMYSRPIEGASQGPAGSERVRRLSDEELAKYEQASRKESQKPVQKPSAEIRDSEDEFRLWESKLPEGGLNGVFKPFDDNQ